LLCHDGNNMHRRGDGGDVRGWCDGSDHVRWRARLRAWVPAGDSEIQGPKWRMATKCVPCTSTPFGPPSRKQTALSKITLGATPHSYQQMPGVIYIYIIIYIYIYIYIYNRDRDSLFLQGAHELLREKLQLTCTVRRQGSSLYQSADCFTSYDCTII